jgi:hypothetical protein
VEDKDTSGDLRYRLAQQNARKDMRTLLPGKAWSGGSVTEYRRGNEEHSESASFVGRPLRAQL